MKLLFTLLCPIILISNVIADDCSDAYAADLKSCDSAYSSCGDKNPMCQMIYEQCVSEETSTNSYLYSNPTGSVQMTVVQNLNKKTKTLVTYIPKVLLTNKEGTCNVTLSFAESQSICTATGSNFCGYNIESESYSLGGIVGASYSPLYQTGIQLTGVVNEANCQVNAFDYVDLNFIPNSSSIESMAF